MTYGNNWRFNRIKRSKSDVFEEIKNSKFSHVTAHIHIYEEMFILFEFAIEKNNNFEFVHFGLVPTKKFFDVLKIKPVIKIRNKVFSLSELALKKILDKLDEFNSKYPDKALT